MDYWFDAQERIAKVDDSWLEFATANGSAGLTPESVLGLHLSSFICDPPTRHLWAKFLRKAREGNTPRVTLRCDAPDRRRLLELTVTQEGELTRVTSTLLSEERREPVALLEKGRGERRGALVSCSWCDRLLVPYGVWMEAETAVERMGYFEMPGLPDISYGICPACLDSVHALADAALPDDGAGPPPRPGP